MQCTLICIAFIHSQAAGRWHRTGKEKRRKRKKRGGRRTRRNNPWVIRQDLTDRHEMGREGYKACFEWEAHFGYLLKRKRLPGYASVISWRSLCPRARTVKGHKTQLIDYGEKWTVRV